MDVSEGWLLLQVRHDDLQHAGNEGYPDIHGETYHWDSSVNHHSSIAVGQGIALWDKRQLLGVAKMQEITLSLGTKTLRRCTSCGLTTLKRRKSKCPSYRCHVCLAEFDNPRMETREVTVYRGSFGTSWIPMPGRLTADELRRLCFQPKSQHSMRPIRWRELSTLLELPF